MAWPLRLPLPHRHLRLAIVIAAHTGKHLAVARSRTTLRPPGPRPSLTRATSFRHHHHPRLSAVSAPYGAPGWVSFHWRGLPVLRSARLRPFWKRRESNPHPGYQTRSSRRSLRPESWKRMLSASTAITVSPRFLVRALLAISLALSRGFCQFIWALPSL